MRNRQMRVFRLMQAAKEGDVGGGLDLVCAKQIALRAVRFGEERTVVVQPLKAHMLAELGPIASKIHDGAIADIVLDHPYGMAAWSQYLERLLYNRPCGFPERVSMNAS